jgi:uncharacterized protein (TIRG00374 family)
MAVDALPWESSQPSAPSNVQIIDVPETRVHRFTDFVALVGALLGIVVVLVLGAYASGTTDGITSDVRGISEILQRLLVAPVNVFSGIVTLIVPSVIVLDIAFRKEPRRILEVLGAALLAFAATVVATYTSTRFGTPELSSSLSVTDADGDSSVSLPAYIAGVAAMLTAAGRRSTRRPISISWNILWIALAVATISGIVTIPAALVTVLIGRVAGLTLRYLLGSSADRAYGGALIEGIRRAGFEPRRLIRADPNDEYAPAELDEVSVALGRTRHGRVYALDTIEGHHLLVVALDGDQHAAGFLTKLWRTTRLRGINTRADVSLRHSAEASALVSHAARTAGVRTARVLGMSHVRDTMVLIYQRPSAARPFADVDAADVSDALLDAIWSEVGKSHVAGISHRSLSSDTILVGHDEAVNMPTVWLSSWELGEVASSPLARRLDRAQVIAMIAAKVGAKRAVDSAFRALDQNDIEQLAPLLQTIAMPRTTRREIRAESSGKVLQDVRAIILERMPTAMVESENITRFGLRTVLMFGLGIVAAWLILSTFNLQQVLEAVRGTEPWWLLIAFGWALLTFFGAALAMIAFSPVRLPMLRVLWVQVAAAYVALVAPAGVGPAVLNLRILTKRNVPTPIAVATVALVQVSAIVVTVVGLVVLTLVTGSEGTLAALPSTPVLIAVGLVAALIVVALIVPQVRAWAVRRVMPTVRQTWPRLVQVLGQPWRLALGIVGNLLLTAAYVGSFHAVLIAFGRDLPLIDIAVLFLLGNAVGAIVPTPGGLGAVEAALTAGLVSAGIPYPVALSIVVVYRAITYWARIPLGYIAMRFMQTKGEL